MSSAVRWASFPYRAAFADPALEFAELSAGTAPDQLCQAARHFLTTNPAAWLEVFHSGSADDFTVHRAWFTCSGCHAKLEAEYDPALG